LLQALDLNGSVGSLERELGVSFQSDEGARFVHRARVDALVEGAIAKRSLAELTPLFESNGVTWSAYRTLKGAIESEPRLFSDNPIFSNVAHGGGQSYPTAGAAARLPEDEREPSAASPRLGAHTDEVLATLLCMSEAEIGKLHDAGIVA
jgi:2-methylfumaryl-CoA isomerase